MSDKKVIPTWLRRASYVAVVLLALAILLQSQAMADWWKLRNYKPSDEIAKLVEDTTMSRYASRLFYVNHAEIIEKKDFVKVCPSSEEKTIVLGCYKSGENGIHILAVTDKRLEGVEEVTAAHEMLHAAYERLREQDREHLNGLLQKFYQNDLKDQRIKDVLKSYQKSEPGQELNEMHSIFGTEIAALPEELETYYKNYFADRSKVTGYAARYQAEFTSRQTQIKKDDAQLSAWKQQITTNEAQLDSRRQMLEQEQADMEAARAAGKTDTYNALVPHYNAEVGAYNMLLAHTRRLIVQYNRLVNERNAIAVETTQLQKALSGSLSPIEQ